MDERECVFDWEANGLNDGFRYPHQIAIIDNDNESICNTYNMRLPHYELPGPIALYKTNTNWKKTKEDHPSLYEIMPSILDDLLSYDIIWAYNYSYDKGVLEESLFNTGRSPYLYKDKIVCDAMPFISIASILYPKVIKIPKIEGERKGKKGTYNSHKLENVYKENFTDDDELTWHVAESDIIATSRLLQKIKSGAPEFWDLRTRMFSKFAREDIFSKRAVWIRYYQDKKQMFPMLPVYERDRDNYFSIDLEKYEKVGGLQEKHKKQIIRVGSGDSKTLPEWLHSSYIKTGGIILDASWFDLPIKYNLPSDSDLLEIKNLINEYLSDLQIWPDKDERYLEKTRFGFPARQDLASWDAFHRAETWDEKVQIKFKDARSKRMAKRIIFDNAPEVLDDNAYKVIEEFIKERWLSIGPDQRPTKGFDSGKTWMTIPTALENIRKCEMEENLEENSELDLDCLKGYKEYLLDLNEQLK